MILGMQYSDFAGHIRKVRGEANLSLSKVAEVMTMMDPDLKVGRQWVWHAETRNKNLTIRRLDLLCRALGKRLELFVLSDDELSVKMSQDEASVWKRLYSHGSRDDILGIVDKLMAIDASSRQTVLNLVNLTLKEEMDQDQRILLEP